MGKQNALRQADWRQEQDFQARQSHQDVYLSPVANITRLPKAHAEVSLVQRLAVALVAFSFFICAFQALRCGVFSVSKVCGLMKQLTAVEQLHAQSKVENARLHDKITRYGSAFGIEEMARERLELSGENEILVRMYPVAVAQAN